MTTQYYETQAARRDTMTAVFLVASDCPSEFESNSD